MARTITRDALTLGKNALALLSIQAATVLLPLIALPYLGRVLSQDKFGEFAFAAALSSFLSTVVDYGFNWTAAQRVSEIREDHVAIHLELKEVIFAKLFIWLTLLVMGSFAIYLFFKFSFAHWLSLMIGPLGSALYPQWLFIGTETPIRATISAVISRTISLALFFMLIHTPQDLTTAIAVQCGTSLLAAAISLKFTARFFRTKAGKIQIHDVISQLTDGYPIFLSSLATNAYTALPVVIVGILVGPLHAGQFSIADKVLTASKAVLGVISQAAMPRVAYLLSKQRQQGLDFVKRSFFTLPIGFLFSVALYVLAPYAIKLFFGQGFAEAGTLIKVLSPIPLLLNLQICTANLFMFNFGFRRQWSQLLISASASFFVQCYLIQLLVAPTYAVAIAIVGTESIVAGVALMYFSRHINKLEHLPQT